MALYTSLLINLILILVIFWILVAISFKREIRAIFERDPAATSFLEVLLTYSGLHALVFHRVANILFKIRIPFLPRWISQLGRFFTGIEIHPGAQIGDSLFIDHGMGVVIGETSIIGDNVTLYQGVTLGGTGKEKGKRHPTLGRNVVVGTGAKVLGNLTVGDNVRIGANAVVLRDVPPNAVVVGVPGRIVRHEGRTFPGINLDHTTLPDPLTQALEKLQHEIDLIEHQLKQHRDEPRRT